MPNRAAILTFALLAACGTETPEAPDRVYAPAVADSPEAAVDGLVVGHRLMAAGQYELALRAFYRAAAERGLDVDILSALGSANLRLGRLGQAEDLLRRAVAEDETFAPAWNNLGVVLMEQGEWGEAERVFRRAVALDNGSDPQIRNNLALALAKLNDPAYDTGNKTTFALVRRGGGDYVLRPTP